MSLFVATRARFKRPRTSLWQPHMYHNHIRCTFQIQMISYHRQRFTPWHCLRWNTSLSDENNESFRGILNHVQFFTLPLRRQSNMPILEIKTRQRHPNQKPKRPRKQNLAQIKQQLSNRLSFFFSDVNLRHDTYARSLLINNKYLPFDVITTFNSIKRLSEDSELILGAATSLGLEITYVNGNMVIGRCIPFHFEDSMEQYRHRVMIVEGWPVEVNTRWIEERLHSLLSIRNEDDMSVNPIVYWGKNVGDGVITIEFGDDEIANRAWETLQFMSQSELPSETLLPNKMIVHFESEKQCKLMIGGLSLLIRGFDAPDKFVIINEDEQPGEATQAVQPTNEQYPRDNEAKVSENSQETKPKKKKWWTNKNSAPSLSQCIKSINELYNYHTALPPPPREWLHESKFNKRMIRRKEYFTHEEMEQRREICTDVANIVRCIHNSIARGIIRALGARDAYAMSDLLNRAMLILSQSPPKKEHVSSLYLGRDAENVIEGNTSTSPYEACLDALNVIRSLNLDINPTHYSYAIRSACHEYRWEEAANIFVGQINGDENATSGLDATGGFVPLDSTFGWDQPLEVGLYAVALDARMKTRRLVEQAQNQLTPSSIVFDTAMRISMIAPSGQENYVLAAGSALGRAGLWSDCLDFATDQNNINKYGPSIAAAAMLACIESHRSAEAIDLYNYFFNFENQNTASEWQWAGGNLSAAKPLFDDLLLRAMGGPARGGYSTFAIQKFCDIVDSGAPLSGNAVVGLMHSIEHDGDWQSAINLLNAFCETYYLKKENPWRLVNEMLSISGIDDIDEVNVLTESELEDLTARMLASAMRTCNDEGFFSLALLLSSMTHSCMEKGMSSECLFSDDKSAVKTITSQKFLSNQTARDNYFHSLSKVGLKRLVNKISGDTEGTNHNKHFPPLGEAMLNALINTNRVLVALNDIRRTNKPLSEEDVLMISRGLTSAINFYLDANHPASAMHLFNYASNVLTTKQNSLSVNNSASFASAMSTFFDDDDRSEPTTATIFQNTEFVHFDSLRINDSLLSAVMKAYTMIGKPEKALIILKEVEKDAENANWNTIQSFNSALEALLESDVAEFMSFFEDSNNGLVMPSTFLALGRKYARECAWSELGELYNEARRRGCVSEELGLLAMQAVCEAEVENGKILLLRKVIDDISNTVGMKTNKWLALRYWHIKRYTGFHYARMLMKWNTPATSQKEELLFAINEMRENRQQGVLTKNAPLFCIVKQGELYESDAGYKGYKISERQRRAAINLIFEACAEAQLSGLIKRPAFTAEVVRSLVSLNGEKQCIQFVKSLIVDREKCRHGVALEYAIKAASESQDNESLDILINAFERSGLKQKT